MRNQEMKCIVCRTEEVEIFDKDGREYYRCEKGHEKPRMIKNKGLKYYKEDGEIIHESVGAVLTKGEKVLLLERRKYPFKHTIPAGHLEKGEKPEKAVLREIEEETGLQIKDREKIFEGKIEDPCRRGADFHYWYLFRAEISGSVNIELNDEALNFRIADIEDLKSLEITKPTETLLLDKSLLPDQ